MKRGREAWGMGLGSEKTQIARSCPRPRPQAPRPSYSRGVTLIELVLSIVIVSIAASAVLGLLSFASRGSADAMVRNQAVAIAQAYLEEIRFKAFMANGQEASRDLFDDVSDYNGLSNTGARDQFGSSITGLEGYNVTVAVTPSALGSIGSGDAKRIDVTVQHANAGVTVVLAGYRTDY
jgi:MSHA pilin protein MshD